MLGNLTGWHLLILVAVVLLLFGATKLPALARSMGKSMRILRSEVRSMHSDDDDECADGSPAPRASDAPDPATRT